MKKTIALALALLLCFSVFAQGAAETKTETPALKVGMVTDSGTIDDRSFNQGTFEGVKKAAEEFGLECTYLRPSGTTTTDYVTAITDLYDAGYRFIACPGFLFADAVAQVQAMYDDLMLVIIDDALSAGIGANSVAVVFKEHESGFLAGLATALKLEEGSVGFLGGMEIPSVQKFNWGFQQGVIYANENYGTKITMDPSNFVYSGSFADIALGQQIANTLFSKGVDVVFCAAGTTGVGGLNETKNRALSGENVWAVGVDVDQYYEGDLGNGTSCVLTSAMKDVTGVAYDMVKAAVEGNFPGGSLLLLGVADDRAGIPATNPNLTPEIEAKVAEVAALIKAGTVVVSDNGAGLIK